MECPINITYLSLIRPIFDPTPTFSFFPTLPRQLCASRLVLPCCRPSSEGTEICLVRERLGLQCQVKRHGLGKASGESMGENVNCS